MILYFICGWICGCLAMWIYFVFISGIVMTRKQFELIQKLKKGGYEI